LPGCNESTALPQLKHACCIDFRGDVYPLCKSVNKVATLYILSTTDKLTLKYKVKTMMTNIDFHWVDYAMGVPFEGAF